MRFENAGEIVTRYIYFDLGKVLLDFDHAKARRQIVELSGTNEAVVQGLVFDDGLLMQFETGAIDPEQFHEAFCNTTNTNTKLDEFLAAYSDIFEVIAPMEQLVSRLHAERFPMGILSNTSSAHWNHVCDGRFDFLPNNFRDLVLSFEVGCMKPEPAIYVAAVELAGCSPSEIFFCDDRTENVAGAVAAGMDAVLFESPDQIMVELRKRLSIHLP